MDGIHYISSVLYCPILQNNNECRAFLCVVGDNITMVVDKLSIIVDKTTDVGDSSGIVVDKITDVVDSSGIVVNES